MDAFWDTAIAPALAALRPRVIVEIGAGAGRTTRKLLEHCAAHDALLHAIDPKPLFDVAAWDAGSAGRLTFHHAQSLDALPEIQGYDVVLIDGDHNWYTVFNELRLIEAQCAAGPQRFPLVLLHDIGWPYGRRDLYFDPMTIPDTFRHPYERGGIMPGTAGLVAGGFNQGLCNALVAHTPRNGVLTAVEDFMLASTQPLELRQIPGLHGLGILFDPGRAAEHPGLAALVGSWDLPKAVRRHLLTIELARVRLLVTSLRRKAKTRAQAGGDSGT